MKLSNLLVYYEIFSKKLTKHTNQINKLQTEIDSFFTNENLFPYTNNNNQFNGLLIDFEFLILKKNFSSKVINVNKPPESKSFFDVLLGSSRKNIIKTKEMKGMVSSTVFTLDQSFTSGLKRSLSTQKNQKTGKNKNKSELQRWSNFRMPGIEKFPVALQSPFIFDFILKYSQR